MNRQRLVGVLRTIPVLVVCTFLAGCAVGAWELNDGEDSRLAWDSSIYGVHGELQSGRGAAKPKWSTTKEVGHLKFARNGWVAIPRASSGSKKALLSHLESQEFAVEAWVRGDPKRMFAGNNWHQYIVAKGEYSKCASPSFGLYTQEKTQGVQFIIRHGGRVDPERRKFCRKVDDPTEVCTKSWYPAREIPCTKLDSRCKGVTGLWDNKWHHLVGTFDGETPRLFVDGVLRTDDTRKSLFPIKYEEELVPDLFIGSTPAKSRCRYDQSFAGDISNVQIWDRALSPVEVYARFVTYKHRFR